VSDEFPATIVGALAGPTNAAEVARGLPAAMVLAAKGDEGVIHDVQAAISGPTLRVYTTDDLAGVEFGGCLKNVYAIAAGCCDGLGLGDNAKAALMTRAVAEMVRVGCALGARQETFYGLSGFGDLVATCHGSWSRNREFGQKIGEGQDGGRGLRDHALLRRPVRREGHRRPDPRRGERDPLQGAPAGRRDLGAHDARAQARDGADAGARLSARWLHPRACVGRRRFVASGAQFAR
jgi:hypothetical protein